MSEEAPIAQDSDDARRLRKENPGYSYCGRCGFPWPVAVNHSTQYSVSTTDEGVEVTGCFPLCQKCWELLGTPEARMPYYVALYDHWAKNGSPISYDDKLNMYEAVKAGG